METTESKQPIKKSPCECQKALLIAKLKDEISAMEKANSEGLKASQRYAELLDRACSSIQDLKELEKGQIFPKLISNFVAETAHQEVKVFNVAPEEKRETEQRNLQKENTLPEMTKEEIRKDDMKNYFELQNGSGQNVTEPEFIPKTQSDLKEEEMENQVNNKAAIWLECDESFQQDDPSIKLQPSRLSQTEMKLETRRNEINANKGHHQFEQKFDSNQTVLEGISLPSSFVYREEVTKVNNVDINFLIPHISPQPLFQVKQENTNLNGIIGLPYEDKQEEIKPDIQMKGESDENQTTLNFDIQHKSQPKKENIAIISSNGISSFRNFSTDYNKEMKFICPTSYPKAYHVVVNASNLKQKSIETVSPSGMPLLPITTNEFKSEYIKQRYPEPFQFILKKEQETQQMIDGDQEGVAYVSNETENLVTSIKRGASFDPSSSEESFKRLRTSIPQYPPVTPRPDPSKPSIRTRTIRIPSRLNPGTEEIWTPEQRCCLNDAFIYYINLRYMKKPSTDNFKEITRELFGNSTSKLGWTQIKRYYKGEKPPVQDFAICAIRQWVEEQKRKKGELSMIDCE
ncbi:hypothetical protein G9A89_003835 [Geosiphon pyriformis]|nr:hypothetical protein G9A89_003835 [Geosiphon pyriformis]